MTTVVCFATGGTIASTWDVSVGGFLPTVGAGDLVAAAGVEGLATVEVVQLAQTNSTSFDPQQVLDWSRVVADALARPEVAGAVVLQGTNTLEECAYVFDLVLAPGKPVVFSGAMRAADELGFDGPRNLAAAVAAAADAACRDLGVLVAMNDEIHAAREAEKLHASALHAFGSPVLGPLGVVHGRRPDVSIARRPARREQLPVARLEPRVALLACALGADAALLDAALAAGARGLVIAAFGSGDVPAAMAPGVERAIAAGVPVVVARRAVAGRVEPRYADPGEGRWLAERGVLFAGDLSAAKARVKLMLALGHGDAGSLGRHFDEERAR
jgi:L-asparaginase